MLAAILILGAINHQIAHIVTQGVVFDTLRARAKAVHPKLGYLLSCHLCFGTWIGFVMAAAVTVPLPFEPAHPLVGFLSAAFLIAFVGRIWNELWAILAQTVALLRERAREREVRRVRAEARRFAAETKLIEAARADLVAAKN